MKITKQEVITKYRIEINQQEFTEIFVNYVTSSDDSVCRLCYPKAFGGKRMKEDEISAYNLKAAFKYPGDHGDTYKYIANELGFDGYDWAGMYEDKWNIRIMTVYSNGDCVNR